MIMILNRHFKVRNDNLPSCDFCALLGKYISGRVRISNLIIQLLDDLHIINGTPQCGLSQTLGIDAQCLELSLEDGKSTITLAVNYNDSPTSLDTISTIWHITYNVIRLLGKLFKIFCGSRFGILESHIDTSGLFDLIDNE